MEILIHPLTGAYNWDYTVSDNRIKKLYELGKELNWNGSIDLIGIIHILLIKELWSLMRNFLMKLLMLIKNLSEEEKIFLIGIIQLSL